MLRNDRAIERGSQAGGKLPVASHVPASDTGLPSWNLAARARPRRRGRVARVAGRDTRAAESLPGVGHLAALRRPTLRGPRVMGNLVDRRSHGARRQASGAARSVVVRCRLCDSCRRGWITRRTTDPILGGGYPRRGICGRIGLRLRGACTGDSPARRRMITHRRLAEPKLCIVRDARLRAERYGAAAFAWNESEGWCERRDSNSHGIATASPSSWCVCQFRHFREGGWAG